MKYVDEFRRQDLAQKLSAAIHAEADPARQYNLMEFCGGHTHAIFRCACCRSAGSTMRSRWRATRG